MTLPSIQLRSGATPEAAVSLLQRLQANCYGESQPVASSVDAKQRAYVSWATTTESELRTIFKHEDATKLFGSARHRDICSMTPGGQVLSMISAEVNGYATRFGGLAAEFDLARRLFEGTSTYLVPDTTFFIEHSDKIENVDFHDIAEDAGSVKVLVPMVVVDELDGLKKSKDRDVRWRAGYSLAVIDRVVTDPPGPGQLFPRQHMPPRGEVSLQIVLDEPMHQRLPINDDEIVDRCVALQSFTSNLTVVTYDTGQSTRARAANVKVKKLTREPGEPPGEGPELGPSQ